MAHKRHVPSANVNRCMYVRGAYCAESAENGFRLMSTKAVRLPPLIIIIIICAMMDGVAIIRAKIAKTRPLPARPSVASSAKCAAANPWLLLIEFSRLTQQNISS